MAERLKVLITGGGGFIGTHVAEAFLAQGWEVVIVGNAPARRGVTVLRGRVGDRILLEQAFSLGIEGVIHLASSTVPGSADNGHDVRTNLVEALELLECSVKYKARKLILASSGGTVYGIPRQLPITEDSPTEPICSYGIVKLALEKYCELYSRMHGLEYVALRISNPYGPGQDPARSQGVIAAFTAKLLDGKPLMLWGTGEVVRDFIHVGDLARLFYLAMRSPAKGVYNAGSGIGLSLNDLIALLGRELGVSPQVLRMQGRRCDVPASVLSCRKAREAFGWAPEIGMEQGVRDVSAWLLDRAAAAAQQTVAIPQLVAVPPALLEGVV